MDDENENNENEIIKQKIEFFLKKKIAAHVSKYNGMFLNGIFKEEIQDGMYYFVDEKIGLTILMADEIFNIDIRQMREEKE